jgi:phospholipid/cholesterol/gamma-HCH transport system substrate-binding protein
MKSLEVRVGLLILVAGAILAVFTFLLSGVSFGDTYPIYVDFNNPGAVQPGAPVRIAGLRVGTVESLEYIGGRLDPRTGRRALVRITLAVEDRVKNTIHDDALFYVTAQGVLGEQFVAIDPGSHDRPVLPEGAIVHGVDPPRLDLALALGYELLQTLTEGLRNNRDQIATMVEDVAGILHSLNDVLSNNRERITRIIANIETATVEANELVTALRREVNGPEVQRILANLDRTMARVAEDIGPILSDVRGVTQGANEVLGPEQRQQIEGAIEDAAQLAERANATVEDVQEIVAHMRRGEGTVGAMLMDEEIYDDLQEMIRDLKHNPWKFFWRE